MGNSFVLSNIAVPKRTRLAAAAAAVVAAAPSPTSGTKASKTLAMLLRKESKEKELQVGSEHVFFFDVCEH